MAGIHATLARSGAPSTPVVNGYTRTSSGFVARIWMIPPVTTGPGSNDVKIIPVSNYAGVLQLNASRGAPAGNDPKHTLIGLTLGSARMYMGERGANGGPEIYTSGFLANVQMIANSVAFKIAISSAGRLRGWANGFPVYDGTPGDAARGYGNVWQSSDNNPSQNQGTGQYSAIVACASNVLSFANCPPNGAVTVTIGAEAPVVVNLDATGAATLDMDSRAFPLAVTFDIHDAGAALVASLHIPSVYGGDVIGLR